MALEVGSRLGVFEVTGRLGEGGMGIVYRATDSTLHRDVALKVLPDAFANDPERLARFQREAQVLASLNHPNIAAIHGLEQSGDVQALVLELVEGPTLQDRTAAGPIPLDEALPIARQIAEALEAAHEQGIIHRDLKPANVKVKEDGTVKVLDFGLAKALEPELSDVEAANSPTRTMTAAATKMGVLMGTAAYMSPEQAAGKPADRRSDIWALGIVLFEMLTGQPLFTGETVSHVLASVLKTEPDWNALPPATPSLLRRLLRRCLEKDRRERLQHIGDARHEINDALSSPDESFQMSAPVSPPATWQRLVPAVLATLGLMAVTGLAVWGLVRPDPPPPRSSVRLAIPRPPETTGFPGYGSLVDFSPDGQTLAFVACWSGCSGRELRAYLRPLGQREAVPVPNSEGTYAVFFSPDGQWLGLNAGAGLKKVSLAGGPPVTLFDGPVLGASWGPDDTVVFGGRDAGLWRVSADGGEAELLASADGEIRWPHALPEGRAVLYTIWRGELETSEIAVLSLESGETKILVDGTSPRYASTGHLLFGREESLWAVPFDVEQLEITGSPVPVLADVQVDPQFGASPFAFGADGALTYVPSGARTFLQRTLTWVDRDGTEEVLTAPPRAYTSPRLSPDGTRVAIHDRDNENDLWVLDLTRQTLSRLTLAAEPDTYPVWTHDGQRVLFASPRDGVRNLYARAADGTGVVERLTESPNAQYPNTISPDGIHLVFSETSPDTGSDLHVLTLDDERRVEPLLVTEFDEGNAEISPDGRWLAYQSDASGQWEIYVQPFPDVDSGRWPISTTGGTRPLWGPDGRELFYLTEAGVLGVTVETGAGFQAGTPALVVEGPYYGTSGGRPGRTYDIATDGQRFLMIRERATDDTFADLRQLHVVLNWFEELKARVPVP